MASIIQDLTAQLGHSEPEENCEACKNIDAAAAELPKLAAVQPNLCLNCRRELPLPASAATLCNSCALQDEGDVAEPAVTAAVNEALLKPRTLLDEVLEGLRPQLIQSAQGKVSEMLSKAFLVEGALDPSVETNLTENVAMKLALNIDENDLVMAVAEHVRIEEEDVAKHIAEGIEVGAEQVAEHVNIDIDEITSEIADNVGGEIDTSSIVQGIVEGIDAGEMEQEVAKQLSEAMDVQEVAEGVTERLRVELLDAVKPLLERMVREACGIKEGK